MRVALADDSCLFRDGLTSLLRLRQIEVVLTAASGGELLTRLPPEMPDVVILDLRMPPLYRQEGLSTACALRARHPGASVLLLSTYVEAAIATTLLNTCGSAGVGYLVKDNVTDLDLLIDCLHRLSRGGTVVDPLVVRGLLSHRLREETLGRLTTREREVLALVAEGHSNAGVAQEMFVSQKTVERYVANIFVHLGLQADPTKNRRVLAALLWLQSPDQEGGPGEGFPSCAGAP